MIGNYVKTIMGSQLSKNKKMATGKNKRNAPYDICDRFCERCGYQKKCRMFHGAGADIKLVIKGGKQNNVKDIFHDLEEGFKQIKTMIRNIVDKKTVDTGKKQFGGREYNKRQKNAELIVEQHPLFRQAQKFVREADGFLRKFFRVANAVNPFLLPALEKEFNDFSFYFPLLSIKIHNALFCVNDHVNHYSEEGTREANRAACIAIRASLVCEKAVGAIMAETKEIYAESLQIITVIRDIRAEIKRIFPDAEKFQDEIIFNTKI
ncbi:MAG: hypothetical protein US76_03670 [Parcubacteria group bacterium GW2011_GWA2_38_13b]|nr:MAG: hypothetical protein US76_03670 [Parcubacteria group bacterium GW2011_GWA2_38_13b]